MIVMESELTLYHASYCVVEDVDLLYCKKRNDFGQGFYLTTSKQQAERFVLTAVKKSGNRASFGFVNQYKLVEPTQLSVHQFVATDADWLHCVCAHRQLDTPIEVIDNWNKYDIVAGKIANDNTMTVINIYLAGGYGDYGSDEAIAMAIKLLKPERLENQLCLKSNAATQKLSFITVQKVELS